MTRLLACTDSESVQIPDPKMNTEDDSERQCADLHLLLVVPGHLAGMVHFWSQIRLCKQDHAWLMFTLTCLPAGIKMESDHDGIRSTLS